MLYDSLLKQIYDQAQQSQSTIQLTMTHGQAARLADLMEGKRTDRSWFANRIDSLLEELMAANQRNTELHRMMSGDHWYWEADGDNHLESLACPIIIQPHDLRELLAAKQEAHDEVMLGEDVNDDDSQLLLAVEKFASKLRKRLENPWIRIFGRNT